MQIHGETAWRVPPLSEVESVGLFISRVQAANATLHVSDQDDAPVRDVCARLEGTPLAIELAAARVPALGLTTIAALLEDRFQLLSRGSRLDPPRHQTLRAAIDWSYALLSEQEQRLLGRLSVFAGGWDFEAAASVCGFGSLPLGDVVDALSGLVEKSLVLAEDRNGSMRYRMLEPIRVYAAERLDGTPTCTSRSSTAHPR
jgi:predicted ATPase